MTLIDEKIIGGKRYIKLAGLSTETPPSGEDIAMGSEFLEVDTGATQYYNATAGSWAVPTPADAS